MWKFLFAKMAVAVGIAMLVATALPAAPPQIRNTTWPRSGGASYPVYVYQVPSSSPLTRMPAGEDYAYGASEEIASGAVVINVRVPADAEVWFDGSKTSQSGSLRSFVTPALESGRDYRYELRTHWMETGRPVEHTRKIVFRAGDRLMLNFTR